MLPNLGDFSAHAQCFLISNHNNLRNYSDVLCNLHFSISKTNSTDMFSVREEDNFLIPLICSFKQTESRKVLNLPPVTILPYQNLPPIVQVLIIDRVGLERGSRNKLREHILVSYSYGFQLMEIVAENKLVLE